MKTVKEFLEYCPEELRPKKIVIKAEGEIMYWGSLENFYNLSDKWRMDMEVWYVSNYYETYPWPGRKVLIEATIEGDQKE